MKKYRIVRLKSGKYLAQERGKGFWGFIIHGPFWQAINLASNGWTSIEDACKEVLGDRERDIFSVIKIIN